MTTTSGEQVIQWLGIRFAVPAAWQVVRHSPTPHRGGLVLVDRYGQRLQLNWTTLADGAEPDLDRMLDDYRARQLEAHPGARLEDLQGDHGWVGVARTFDGSGDDSDGDATVVTRAVRYDAPTGRVLEAIFNAGPDEADLVKQVLGSVEAAEPIDAVTRLRVFDMDVTTPADWRLASAQVKPADVMLRYQHRSGRDRPTRQELFVRRMGMASTWWHGDAERFIRRTSPKVTFEIDEWWYGDRTVTRGVGIEPGPSAKRLSGMLRRREDLVWHDARANAVYHVVVLSWSKREVSPALFRIEDASVADAGAEALRRGGLQAGESRRRRPGPSQSLRAGVGDVEGLELSDLLAAVPMANQAVREQRNGQTLILYVPIRQRWWMGPPFCWIPGVHFRKERGVALDSMGQEVWQGINGRRTVEQLVDRFAAKHQVRFHEARISVMTFLEMLMRRELVAVVGSKQ